MTVISALGLQTSRYETPAQYRAATRRTAGPSVLPGGRLVSPLGRQFLTGPGPFGLGISPAGKVATVNLGPERLSFTVWEVDKKAVWTSHNYLAAKPKKPDADDRKDNDDDEQEFRSTFMGLAFASDKQLWITEGNSGKVRMVDPSSGEREKLVRLNAGGYRDSFSGDLTLDSARGILYITDQANFRLVAVDTKKGRVISSVRVGRLPFAVALSTDGKTAFVTHVGVFEYQQIPGATKATALENGLPFPAFGFPSKEAAEGVERERASGKVAVPGLGDANKPESNSVAIVNVSDPAAMTVTGYVRTGKPFSKDVAGGSNPSGVVVAGGLVYASNAHDDTVTVIEPGRREIVAQIELRIPVFEPLRGVMPLGMFADVDSGRLYVTEAGINAVGVIDLKTRKVLGHIPAGWFPTRVAMANGSLYVANGKGAGSGPNLPGRESYQDGSGLVDILRRGTVSMFPAPLDDELPKLTETVFANNGFRPVNGAAPAIPTSIKHVVMIVKENRTFDDVFGDVTLAPGGPVAGLPALAHFGLSGIVQGGRERLSLQNVEVTPNHHDLAKRWAMSDNFYSDSEVSVDGHHWLVGNYPDAWTESSLMAAYAGQKDFRVPTTAPGRLIFAQSNSSVHPEEIQQAGTLWHHLERNRIAFRNFGEGFELAGVEEVEGEKPTGARYLTNVPMPDPLYRNSSRNYPGFNMNIPDQFRATQLIAELKERFEDSGKELPQFIYIHLPNDHIAPVRPADGYPYPASYVADNDYALGRILEYLSHTKWWKEMTVFVTEDDAQGGRDHIDAHRTLLMTLGPYVKKNYVMHQNSSFPGLLKTVFRILGIPPLNLYDATATDLSSMFTDQPDFNPYVARRPDPRIFIPEQAREPKDPKPSIRMDR